MCRIVHPCDKLFDWGGQDRILLYTVYPCRGHTTFTDELPNTWSILIHSYICVRSSCRLLTSRQNDIIQTVTIKYSAKFEFLTVLFMNAHYFTTLKNVSICKQRCFGSAGKDRSILGLKEIGLTTNEATIPKNFKFSFPSIYEKYSKPEILLTFSRYTVT
jgi:hypothetical protein